MDKDLILKKHLELQQSITAELKSFSKLLRQHFNISSDEIKDYHTCESRCAYCNISVLKPIRFRDKLYCKECYHLEQWVK